MAEQLNHPARPALHGDQSMQFSPPAQGQQGKALPSANTEQGAPILAPPTSSPLASQVPFRGPAASASMSQPGNRTNSQSNRKRKAPGDAEGSNESSDSHQGSTNGAHPDTNSSGILRQAASGVKIAGGLQNDEAGRAPKRPAKARPKPRDGPSGTPTSRSPALTPLPAGPHLGAKRPNALISSASHHSNSRSNLDPVPHSAQQKRNDQIQNGNPHRQGQDELDSDPEGEGDGDDDAETEDKKNKRRNRVHFSCVECHRRKQKCDRLQPCTQCLIRKVPHLCRPFINGFEDPGVYEGDLKTRLGRIEGILERIVPLLGMGVGEGGSGAGSESEGAKEWEDGMRSRDGGRRFGLQSRTGRESMAWRGKALKDKASTQPDKKEEHSGGSEAATVGDATPPIHDPDLEHATGRSGPRPASDLRKVTTPSANELHRLLADHVDRSVGIGNVEGVGQSESRIPGDQRRQSDFLGPGGGARSGGGAMTGVTGSFLQSDAGNTSINQSSDIPDQAYDMLLTLPLHHSPPETASSPSLSHIGNLRHRGSVSSLHRLSQPPDNPSLRHSFSQPQLPLQQHPSRRSATKRNDSVNTPGTTGRPLILLDEPSTELRGILETIGESGITRKQLISLLETVPEKGLSDRLVELYFREIDWTRYKLHRPAFSRQYIHFFEVLAANPHNPALDKHLIKWLPLYFSVLAIAVLSATADMVGGETGQKTWSRRFHGSSRFALSSAKALQRDSLDVIYAGLLTARYMLLVRRAAEGATPLTSAYQLGLYRDGLVLNLNDKKEIELRRRAWAMVYHLDRTTALLVGRPTSISDAHSDTQEPANLDDLELESDFDPRGHPFTVPTEWTQLILRHRLAQIIGRISDHTFAIKPPEYSAVLKLDRELLAWQSNLPAFLATHHADTSMDRKYHFIFVQRHLLACEFLFARITLHRPYLLRKCEQSDQYSYSREAAIESAKADLVGRRLFMFEKPVDLKVNSGGYRVLNSYIVLGVAIKLDPTSPRAEELRQLLEVVAGTTPDELGRFSEPMVKDEMAIVDFLTQRARSGGDSAVIRSSAPIPPYSHILPSHKNAPSMLARRRENPGQERSGNKAEESSGLAIPIPAAPRPAEDPAWSFVAPQQQSLDVHQPFGENAQHKRNPVSRQYPPPLAAPEPRQRNPHNIPPWEQAGWGNPYAITPTAQGRPSVSPIALSQQSLPMQADTRSLRDMSEGSAANSFMSANTNFGAMADTNMEQGAFAPVANPSMTADEWADLDNWWNSNQAALGTPMPANSSTTGQMGFNPFALSQFGQTENLVEDSSETAFLNLLLSTIANSSAPN